jgi:hypothetical protein
MPACQLTMTFVTTRFVVACSHSAEQALYGPESHGDARNPLPGTLTYPAPS